MLIKFLTLTAFLVPVFAFILSLFYLLKAPRSKIAFLWFLKSLVVGICGLGIYLLIISCSVTSAYFSNYITYLGAILIAPIYFQFCLTYTNLEKKNRILIILAYFFAVFFLIVMYGTNLFIAGVSGKSIFNYWIDTGPLYYIFIVYFLFYIITSIYLLINGYRKNIGVEKNKIAYLIIAAFIGFGGGGTIIFPQIFGIFPYGYFITFIYPILLVYGMFLKKY